MGHAGVATDAEGAEVPMRAGLKAGSLWRQPLGRGWLAAAACLALFVVGVGVVAPSLGTARGVGRMRGETAPTPNAGYLILDKMVGNSLPSVSGPPVGAFGVSDGVTAGDRFVIRKSTIDLQTSDVRGTYAKAALVINEALSEYIESTSLTGEGLGAQGIVTLRVSAARLGEVLNQLRGLATVTSESATGQDVTETVVDLEARVRNEQRIERELLELIDTRPDAPLKEILDIRAELAKVRGQIESLIGQRERLGRLVSLATVLITIRAENAPVVPPAEESLGTYFLESVEEAWEVSLRSLANTAALFVRVLVGGLVWWVLLAAVALGVWRGVARAGARRAREPVPVG